MAPRFRPYYSDAPWLGGEQLAGYDPDTDEFDIANATDEQLGIDPLELDESEIPEFEQGLGGRIVEGFAGLQGLGRPARTFGEGLVGGFGTGLGRAGTRIQQERQKFEESSLKRQAERDKANREATAAYRLRRQQAQKEFRSTRAEEKKERDRLNRDFPKPTEDQLKAAPWLRRAMDQDGRVTRSVLELASKPEKAEKPEKEPLVAIEGPSGPVFVKRSEALGKSPPKPAAAQAGKTPSAAEREKLSADVTALEQQSAIQQLYKPEFVGPASGFRGAVGARLGAPGRFIGAGLKAGEADFKAALATYRNAAINALTGTAAGVQEAKRLLQQIPSESDPSEVFEAKLRQTEANLRRVANERRKTFTQTGLDISGLSPLPAEPGTTASRQRRVYDASGQRVR